MGLGVQWEGAKLSHSTDYKRKLFLVEGGHEEYITDIEFCLTNSWAGIRFWTSMRSFEWANVEGCRTVAVTGRNVVDLYRKVSLFASCVPL